MPQMRRFQSRPPAGGEQVRASSVLFGLVIITALIVATAAWMGGSLGSIGKKTAGVMDAAARSMGLAVDRVEVQGVGEEHEAIIRAAIMVEPGENLFRADPKKIAERVEATGAVADVRVYRLWPDTILVVARPSRPVALHRRGEAWLVIDSAGEVRQDFDPTAYPALPRLVGADAPEHWPRLEATLAGFPDIASALQGAIHTGGGRWTVLLEGGVMLKLPSSERVEEALERVDTLQFQSQILNGRYAIVDARTIGASTAQSGQARIVLTPRTERSASLSSGGRG